MRLKLRNNKYNINTVRLREKEKKKLQKLLETNDIVLNQIDS